MKRSLMGTLLTLFAVLGMTTAASAAELYSGGTKVATGTQIVATSTGAVSLLFSSGAEIYCNSSSLTGVLSANGPKYVRTEVTQSQFSGTASEGKCGSAMLGNSTVSLDVPSCWATVGAGTLWVIEPPECMSGSGSWGLTVNSAMYGKCHYWGGLRFDRIQNGPLLLRSQSEALLSSDSGVCGSKVRMIGTFKLTTAAGGELTVL